jgi:hypothetical protein
MPTRSTCLALILFAAACGNSAGTDEPLGGSLAVSGDVYDWKTGSPITGEAIVKTSALSPPPTIEVTGSSFVITDVLEYSAFQIVAASDPTHRATYNATTEVTTNDLDGVKAETVPEDFLAGLATAFGVTPDAANGIVFMQLVDTGGNPKASVAASNIILAGATGTAPKFLDASLAAAPSLTTSSTSGWAVIYNVPPGVVTLGTAVNATATLAAPSAPVASNAVTLVRATVTDGNMPPMLPTNVSFATTIVPIFSARGCINCHSGNGPGKDLGGLQLDGGVMKIYKELIEEDPTRVKTDMAEKSLLLTMPSAESPPDGHPNVTFTGPQDPDYMKILAWIKEGAKNN